MPGMRARVLGIMLAAVIALAVGETLLARGMKRVDASSSWWSQARAIALSPWVLAGATLLGVHLGLYMIALRDADLSVVLPLTAGSYPLATLLAKVWLHEDVGTWRWVGTSLITLGVAVIGAAEAVPRP